MDTPSMCMRWMDPADYLHDVQNQGFYLQIGDNSSPIREYYPHIDDNLSLIGILSSNWRYYPQIGFYPQIEGNISPNSGYYWYSQIEPIYGQIETRLRMEIGIISSNSGYYPQFGDHQLMIP